MGASAEIFHGALPLVTEGMRISYAGPGAMDSGSMEVLVAAASVTADLASVGIAKGAKVSGYHSLWVETLAVEPEGVSLKMARVSCIGLADSGDKRKRSMRVFGRSIAVGPIEHVIIVVNDQETAKDPLNPAATVVVPKRRIPKVKDDGDVEVKEIVTPTGLAERWNIAEPIIQVEDVYFTTSAPDMSQAGTAQTPSNAPTPPAFVWGSYQEPVRYNHPKGWVLEGRDVDEIFNSGGSGLWQVRDAFSYYQAFQPD